MVSSIWFPMGSVVTLWPPVPGLWMNTSWASAWSSSCRTPDGVTYIESGSVRLRPAELVSTGVVSTLSVVLSSVALTTAGNTLTLEPFSVGGGGDVGLAAQEGDVIEAAAAVDAGHRVVLGQAGEGVDGRQVRVGVLVGEHPHQPGRRIHAHPVDVTEHGEGGSEPAREAVLGDRAGQAVAAVLGGRVLVSDPGVIARQLDGVGVPEAG